MIGLTCRGCGWAGRVGDHLAGRCVTCYRCRSISVVPSPPAERVFGARRIDAIEGGSHETQAEAPPAVDWGYRCSPD